MKQILFLFLIIYILLFPISCLAAEQEEQILKKSQQEKIEQLLQQPQQKIETVMQSAYNNAASLPSYGLPVMNITLYNTSLDIINAGSKNIKYEGNSVAIYDKNNNFSFLADIITLKGHGNSSWRYKKKSYQIKFDKKVALFNMPEAKKYLLVSNDVDLSLIRNAISYDLAKQIGISPSNYQFIDLYVDNQYIGNYMLIQKVQIGKNSVNLKNDDAIITEVDIHPDEDDITFRSKISNALLSIKDSNTNDYNLFLSRFEQLEQAAINKDWNTICSLADIDSFVKYYLLSEFTSNPDAQRTSFYIYMDGANDILHAGPAWDFDRCYGNYYNTFYTNTSYPSIYLDSRVEEQNGTKLLSNLILIPQFRQKVENLWRGSFKQFIQQEYNTINILQNQIAKSAAQNQLKWGKKQNNITATQQIINWMKNRQQYLDILFGQNEKIDTSISYKISNGAFCITTTSIDPVEGDIINIRKSRVKQSQLWSFELVDNGEFYKIKQQSSNMVLTVNSVNKDTQCIISKDQNLDGQKWKIIKNGNSYIILSKLNGWVLDIKGGILKSGSIIQCHQYNNTSAQIFILIQNPYNIVNQDMSGEYVIINNDLILSSAGKNIRDNIKVSNSGINWFKLEKQDNYYIIKNIKTGYILDAQNGETASGTNIWQYRNNNTDAQKWFLIRNNNQTYSIVNKLNGLVLNVSGNNVNVININNKNKQSQWILLQKVFK